MKEVIVDIDDLKAKGLMGYYVWLQVKHKYPEGLPVSMEVYDALLTSDSLTSGLEYFLYALEDSDIEDLALYLCEIWRPWVVNNYKMLAQPSNIYETYAEALENAPLDTVAQVTVICPQFRYVCNRVTKSRFECWRLIGEILHSLARWRTQTLATNRDEDMSIYTGTRELEKRKIAQWVVARVTGETEE